MTGQYGMPDMQGMLDMGEVTLDRDPTAGVSWRGLVCPQRAKCVRASEKGHSFGTSHAVNRTQLIRVGYAKVEIFENAIIKGIDPAMDRKGLPSSPCILNNGRVAHVTYLGSDVELA